jgi:hypothetical protein
MSSPDPDLDNVADPHRRLAAKRLIERKHADPRPRIGRPDACEFFGESESKIIRREQAADTKLITYRTEGRVFYDTDSCYDALIADVLNSRDRVRDVPTAFKPKRRRVPPRTRAQQAALREHNERLHRERLARQETETASS